MPAELACNLKRAKAESSMWHVLRVLLLHPVFQSWIAYLKVEHHETVIKSCDLKVFSSRNSICAWGGRPNSPPFRSTILGAAWPICYQPPLNSSNIPQLIIWTLWLPSKNCDWQQLEFLIALFWYSCHKVVSSTRSFLTNPLQLVWQLSSDWLPR